jgi:hypothetical protein
LGVDGYERVAFSGGTSVRDHPGGRDRPRRFVWSGHRSVADTVSTYIGTLTRESSHDGGHQRPGDERPPTDSTSTSGDERVVNRRGFLVLGAGTVGGVGLVHTGERALDGRFDVRVWFSEAADAYETVRPRVVGYLRRALDGLRAETSVSVGGTVDVSTEDGYRVTASGEWPSKLATGAVTPADDVNLLVTDGSMATAPTGIGVPHVASVGGARHVARMPPVSETTEVLARTNRALVTQIVIHECGHALGLRHEDGDVVDRGDHVVVTPMVSGYAWADEAVRGRRFDRGVNACGTAYHDVSGKDVHLDTTFSPCARGRLRRLLRRPL